MELYLLCASLSTFVAACVGWYFVLRGMKSDAKRKRASEEAMRRACDEAMRHLRKGRSLRDSENA